MDWIRKASQNKRFWHITEKKNIDSILKNGLIQSKNGQMGKGLYAIERDYDVLDSVVELITQEKCSPSEQVIIEFGFSGEYYYREIENLIYSNEGWLFIKEDICIDKITNVIDLESI